MEGVINPAILVIIRPHFNEIQHKQGLSMEGVINPAILVIIRPHFNEIRWLEVD
ncbi:hypothetical protein ACVGA5_002249 [Morganella morganii]|uniref:hypothetical protein n=1 Tax=Morganella morganii TaxID=582 RepID=UPI0025A52F80|nr:hypothetical protein [Morganella morganii]EKW3934300.1 hypothetical protein [Morganella morganii]EKW3939985.1 hypothetical protein [Morganella morganii]